MSTAHGAIHGTALLPQVPRILTPLLLALPRRIAAEALAEGEAASRDVVGISTVMTETGITIHVTEYQNVHPIDPEAGPLLDARKGTFEKSVTLTEETVTTDVSPESMILTLALQVLRNLVCEHSTRTVDQVPPT